MQVFNRPPAWPGFNNYNLTTLADYLYRENLDGQFSMRCDLALTTNTAATDSEWAFHPIGYCARTVSQLEGNSRLLPTEREPFNAYYSRVLIRPQSFRARWHWCFSPEWAKVDDTAKGCAQRIFVLCHTGMPSNWAEQVLGKEPLSYTDIGNLGIIDDVQYEGGHFEFTRPSIDDRKKSGADPFPLGKY